MDPYTVYGMAAASMAVEDAQLHEGMFDPERTGVLVSPGIGGCSICRYSTSEHWKGGLNGFSSIDTAMITNILSGIFRLNMDLKGLIFALRVLVLLVRIRLVRRLNDYLW